VEGTSSVSYRRIRSAPAPTCAGYSIAVRNGYLFLVDQHPDRDDCRISPNEARELAQRLLHAAAVAERERGRPA
jgi:hypothetical protein